LIAERRTLLAKRAEEKLAAKPARGKLKTPGKRGE
jgi:hypothetical protein